MKRGLRIMAILGIMAFVAAVPPAGGASGNKYGNASIPPTECEDANGDKVGEISFAGPTTLWPPNHKYVNVTITATSEDEDDKATVATEGAHNQVDGEGNEAPGSGNTDPSTDVNPAVASDEGTPSASVTLGIRAERAGTVKAGRTYTIMVVATFEDSDGDGNMTTTECDETYEIFVPHDQRGGAGWK